MKKIIFKSKKNLCIGLDPDIALLPNGYQKNMDGLYQFLKDIIEITFPYTIAYKFNIAFYESYGIEGFQLMEKILSDFESMFKYKEKKVIIADAKRGDIGNTSKKYAIAFFEHWNFDAITLHPYMGYDTIQPFIEYKHKGSIVLCLTSNPSNRDFELSGNPFLFERIAFKIKEWNQKYDNIMAVVGATNKKEHLIKIKEILEDMPVLIPGIGAQGGDLELVLSIFGKNAIINIGRSILYISSEKENMEFYISNYISNYYNKVHKYL